MIRKLMFGIAATSAALVAIPAAPAMAQEAEEARTTYRVVYLKLADGAGPRWTDIQETYNARAAEKAGLKPVTVHWLMTGNWDLMLLIQMPDGLSALDTHNPPAQAAYNKAFVEVAGGEEAARKIRDELGGLVTDSLVTYSHTHP